MGMDAKNPSLIRCLLLFLSSSSSISVFRLPSESFPFLEVLMYVDNKSMRIFVNNRNSMYTSSGARAMHGSGAIT